MKRINLSSITTNTIKRIKLSYIITIIILLIIYNLIYLCIHQNHLDYWTIFWTCIGSLAVPISIVIFFYQERESQKNKLDEETRLILTELFPKFISKSNLYNLNKESDEQKIQLILSGTTILSKIDMFNDMNKNGKSDDFSDYISSIVATLLPFSAEIHSDFSTISHFFEEYEEEYGNVKKSDVESKKLNEDVKKLDYKEGIDDKKIKRKNEYKLFNSNINIPSNFLLRDSDNVLIVRTHGDKDSDILGNWKISAQRAENLHYIIGVNGTINGPKKYLKTFKIKKCIPMAENRFKFIKYSDEQSNLDDIDQDFIDSLGESLQKWTAMNPVRYLSGLIEKIN